MPLDLNAQTRIARMSEDKQRNVSTVVFSAMGIWLRSGPRNIFVSNPA